MNAQELHHEIEECLKLRREYTDHENKHPFKEIEFRVEGENLIFELWGGEIVFHDLTSYGSGKFYFNDTSGG